MKSHICDFFVGTTVLRDSGNEHRHHLTSGLDTDGKMDDINEDGITSSFFTTKNISLDGGAIGNGLIGVDTLGRLLATEVLLEELLDFRDTN